MKNAKNYFIEGKICKLTESGIPHQTCFNINLATCGLPSNMKCSSHKTWHTSLLFLKPLKIQSLKRKSGGTWHIMSPPSEKVGGTRPPCPPPNSSHFSNQNGNVLATYLGNEMSLFCNITRSFWYRRNDVSFILQLIWGDAIFVKVVAVSFSLSSVARIALTKLKTTA